MCTLTGIEKTQNNANAFVIQWQDIYCKQRHTITINLEAAGQRDKEITITGIFPTVTEKYTHYSSEIKEKIYDDMMSKVNWHHVI